jgi:hypothetical protein
LNFRLQKLDKIFAGGEVRKNYPPTQGKVCAAPKNSGETRIFFVGGGFTPLIYFDVGVEQIQMRMERRENVGLGTVAPVRRSTQFANE